MRSTWLPLGFALVLPAACLVAACGPGSTSTTSTGGSTTSTTGGGGTSTSTTGGAGTAGSSSTGTTTTTNSGPPANDLCPGQEIVLAIDKSTTVEGTLTGAKDDYMAFCTMNDMNNQPDVVYQLDVPASATVTVEVKATGFTPALSLRKQQCASRVANDVCFTNGMADVVDKYALAKGTYWLVVKSADAKAGDFSLSVTYATPKCGDGVVNPGEDCDPPNPSPDDGCWGAGTPTQCHYGKPPQDMTILDCPGGLIPVVKGDSFQLGPYNNGAGKTGQSNNIDGVNCKSAATGHGDVFHIVPAADGMLFTQIGMAQDGKTLYCNANPNDCADFIMFLRKAGCATQADQVGCADNTPDPMSPFGFDELLTIKTQVTAGTDYYLIVDGVDTMFGDGGYYLQIALN